MSVRKHAEVYRRDDGDWRIDLVSVKDYERYKHLPIADRPSGEWGFMRRDTFEDAMAAAHAATHPNSKGEK